MIIAEMRVHPYRIPFRQPFATAHGTLLAREGAIVELVTEDGIVGVGDMAAVTELGAPDVTTLVAAAQEYAPLLRGWPLGQVLFEALMSGKSKRRAFTVAPRSLLFALETATLDAAQLSAQMRHGAAYPVYDPLLVPVNATIGVATTDQAVERARAAVAAGFRCIKLKVGMMPDAAPEIERVRAVRTAIGPEIHLRLDANEAWTLPQATAILQALASEDIQFVEQPLMRTELADMYRLRKQTPIPIAADESITDLASIKRVIKYHAADVIILKPQLLGGYMIMPSMFNRAFEANLRSVFTSSLESGIGVAATIIIAITRGPSLMEYGLATLPLLEDDLILEELPIRDGCISLPPSGRVTLDRAALERYRLEVPGL
jgi:o-succinylbenzoate synthase